MKKLLLLSVLALLLTAGALSGCQQQLEVTDYSYSPKLQKLNEGGIYPNSNIPIRLSIASSSDAITKEDVFVTLKELKGAGSLYPTGSTTPVEVGIKMAHKFAASLNYNFVPSAEGEVTLTFTLEHGSTIKDVDLTLNVSAAAYFAHIIDKPENVIVGEPYTMKMAIVENEEVAKATRAGGGVAPSGKFTVTAEMVEGLGMLKIKDKILINFTETLLAPVLAQNKNAQSKAEQSSIELTKDEVVSMQYLSMSQEKNRLTINITDEYGNVVNNAVLFIATPPPVALSSTIKADSTYQVGAVCDYYVNMSNTSASSNNEYTLDWSFHKDNKVTELQMFDANAKPIPIGTPVKINHLVTNKLFFSSTVVGLRYITLNVTDKFGITTFHNDTINIKALPVNYKLDLANKGLQTFVAHKFMGTLTAPVSSNKYSIEYEVSGEKINAKNVLLKIDDKTYTPGMKIPITPGQQQFEVRLDSAGIYKVNFLIADSYDRKFPYEVTLTGVTTGLNILATPPAKINFGSSAPMEVIVPTFATHIDNYKAMVQFDDGSAAAITVNGQAITPAVEFSLKKGTNAWTITPNKLNTECAFTITYKTNFGQEEKKRIVIPLVLPQLTATVENTKATADLTESLLYNLVVSEPNYTEEITVTVKYLTGLGNLSIGGKNVANEGTLKISRPGISIVSFKPTAIGPVKIELRVADKLDQNKIVYLEGVASQPPFTATIQSTTTDIKYQSITPASLSIAQALFTDDYTVTASSTKGGTLKIAGKIQPYGLTFPLKNGVHNIEYTPTQCGENILSFKILDKMHNEEYRTATITYNVTPYPLVVTIPSQSADEVNRTESMTFGLSIDEEIAPNTPYTLKYSMAKGGGTLKIGSDIVAQNVGKNLTKGVHTFTYTPTVAGLNTLNLEVEDMFGQKKTVTVNVSAKHNPLVVSSTPKVTAYINNNATVNLTINEDSYTGSYHFKYTTDKSGTLTNGGAAIAQGAAVTVAKGTTTLSYKPLVKGPHSLIFTVTDDFGQEQEVKTYVTAELAEIVATPNASSVNATINSPIAFTVATSEAGYSGGFKIRYISSSTGALSVNGSALMANTPRDINAGTITLSYIPAAIGTHTLTFTVSDDNGQSKSFNVSVNSTHAPLTFTSGFTAASGFESRTTNVSVNTSGATPIKVKYSGGNGTMLRNSSVVSPNTDVTVSANETWQYTPSSTGSHSLTFTATDKNGQIKSVNTSYTANVSTVSASMSTSNSTIVVHNVTNSTVRASNSAGDNTYTYTYSGAYNGSVTPSSGSSSTGNTVFQFTPNTIGTHTINITATDSFGKSATTTWTINSVAAEIGGSFNGGGVNIYVGFSTQLSLYLTKPYYTGQYNVAYTLSSNGSLSQSPTQVNNGSTTIMMYTPKTKGTHIITVNINDSEGKTKKFTQAVFVTLPTMTTTSTPGWTGIRLVLSENESKFINPMEQINVDQYPSGAKFTFHASNGAIYNESSGLITITCPRTLGEKRTSLVEVVDMYGQVALFKFEVEAVTSKYL